MRFYTLSSCCWSCPISFLSTFWASSSSTLCLDSSVFYSCSSAMRLTSPSFLRRLSLSSCCYCNRAWTFTASAAFIASIYWWYSAIIYSCSCCLSFCYCLMSSCFLMSSNALASACALSKSTCLPSSSIWLSRYSEHIKSSGLFGGADVSPSFNSFSCTFVWSRRSSISPLCSCLIASAYLSRTNF